MYKGPAETAAFCTALREVDFDDSVDVVVCPPFVSLAIAVQLLAGTEIGVAAQNVHWEREGAFTGETATPELAQEAHAFIKALLDAPVLYGGSVKPENARDLLSQPDVDGALVGGASLDVQSFAAICQASLS